MTTKSDGTLTVQICSDTACKSCTTADIPAAGNGKCAEMAGVAGVAGGVGSAKFVTTVTSGVGKSMNTMIWMAGALAVVATSCLSL